MTFAEPPTRRLERANPIPGQAPDAIGDTAGDPLCWLDKVCPACGLLTVLTSRPAHDAVRTCRSDPSRMRCGNVTVRRLGPPSKDDRKTRRLSNGR